MRIHVADSPGALAPEAFAGQAAALAVASASVDSRGAVPEGAGSPAGAAAASAAAHQRPGGSRRPGHPPASPWAGRSSLHVGGGGAGEGSGGGGALASPPLGLPVGARDSVSAGTEGSAATRSGALQGAWTVTTLGGDSVQTGPSQATTGVSAGAVLAEHRQQHALLSRVASSGVPGGSESVDRPMTSGTTATTTGTLTELERASDTSRALSDFIHRSVAAAAAAAAGAGVDAGGAEIVATPADGAQAGSALAWAQGQQVQRAGDAPASAGSAARTSVPRSSARRAAHTGSDGAAAASSSRRGGDLLVRESDEGSEGLVSPVSDAGLLLAGGGGRVTGAPAVGAVATGAAGAADVAVCSPRVAQERDVLAERSGSPQARLKVWDNTVWDR